MRAVEVTRFEGPEVLRTTERQAPVPGPGQVSIEVAYAGLNFAEVMARRGDVPRSCPPVVPGLEVSGRVAARLSPRRGPSEPVRRARG